MTIEEALIALATPEPDPDIKLGVSTDWSEWQTWNDNRLEALNVANQLREKNVV